jgi:hypothetical protein
MIYILPPISCSSVYKEMRFFSPSCVMKIFDLLLQDPNFFFFFLSFSLLGSTHTLKYFKYFYIPLSPLSLSKVNWITCIFFLLSFNKKTSKVQLTFPPPCLFLAQFWSQQQGVLGQFWYPSLPVLPVPVFLFAQLFCSSISGGRKGIFSELQSKSW